MFTKNNNLCLLHLLTNVEWSDVFLVVRVSLQMTVRTVIKLPQIRHTGSDTAVGQLPQ